MASLQLLRTLQIMWKARPMQSDSLQGLYPAEGADLAGSPLGSSSGWQEGKQDWGLPAVMGKHV